MPCLEYILGFLFATSVNYMYYSFITESNKTLDTFQSLNGLF